MDQIKFPDFAKGLMSRSFKDSEESRAFLFSYRKSCTSEELLEIWSLVETHAKIKRDTQQRNSVTVFLYIWISLFWFTDFTSSQRKKLIDRFKEFPNSNDLKLLIIRLYKHKARGAIVLQQAANDITPRLKSSAPLIGGTTPKDPRKALLESISGSSTSLASNDSPHHSGNYSSNNFSANFTPPEPTILTDFFRWTPREIASSLAIQFDSLFVKLEPLEFLNRVNWGDKKKKRKYSSLDDMVGLFNKVSAWCVTEILTQKEISHQSIVIEKLLQVAQKSESLGNFDCALAILSGLNNFGIQRLRNLWDALPDRSHHAFATMEEMFAPVNNFRLYHEALMQRKPPVIPYIGIIMRDFTFMVETPVELQKDFHLSTGKILWNKWVWVANMQKEVYRLPVPMPLLNFVSKLNVIENDEDIHRISMQFTTRPEELFRRDSQSSASTALSVMTEDSSVHAGGRSRLHSIGSTSSRSSRNSTWREDGDLRKVLERKNTSHLTYDDRNVERKGLRHMNVVTAPKLVSVPWAAVEKFMQPEYESLMRSSEKGTLTTADARHLVVRAGSISADFISFFSNLLTPSEDFDSGKLLKAATRFLHEIGVSIGSGNARVFREKWLSQHTENMDPMSMIAAASIQSAHLGWGRWRVSSVSNNLDDLSFRIKYKLINSFEAVSWHTNTTLNICQLSAGYASGWLSESLGYPISVVEISCRATGSKHCAFIGCPKDLARTVIDEIKSDGDKIDMSNILIPVPLCHPTRSHLRVERGSHEEIRV